MLPRIKLPRKFAVLFFFSFISATIFGFSLFTDYQTFAGENNSPQFANLNLVVSITQDGLQTLNTTADTLNGINICASNPTPGCDFSQSNGIVRTNDSVVYLYDYSINGDSDDVTLTATAPFGTTWNVLPGFCNSGLTKNSGDGITTASVITCKRGVQTTGTAESLPFTLIILGSNLHNTALTASGLVSGLTSPAVNAVRRQLR